VKLILAKTKRRDGVHLLKVTEAASVQNVIVDASCWPFQVLPPLIFPKFRPRLSPQELNRFASDCAFEINPGSDEISTV
jgi:hypothetical protein